LGIVDIVEYESILVEDIKYLTGTVVDWKTASKESIEKLLGYVP
jgi:hypothetical protein